MRRAYIALAVLLIAAAVLLFVGLSRRPRSPVGGPSASVPRSTPRVTGAWLASSTEVVPLSADDWSVDAGVERPCIEGRVVNASSGAGLRATVRYTIGGDEVLRVVGTDATGAFAIGTSPVRIIGVAADGAWGMEPSLDLQTCARGLVLPLEPHTRWKVHVEEPDGGPISGVMVSARVGDQPSLSLGPLGIEGTLEAPLRDGTTLVARHPDFETTVRTLDAASAVAGEVWLVMPRRTGAPSTTKLTGRVELADGTLPASARIIVEGRAAEAGWVELMQSAEVRNGEFEVVVEGRAPWRVRAAAPIPGSSSVETSGEPVVLRVRAEAGLRGAVTDRRGQPVTGFVITVAEKQNLAESAARTHNVVNARGEWQLAHVPATTVLVSAAALGFAPAEPQEVDLASGETKAVNLTLDEGGSLTGLVLDRSSRAPLVGAVVSMEGDSQAGLLLSTHARSDLDGGFMLPGIRPGRRSMLAVAEGHHARLMTVQVREGAQTPLEVLLTPVATGEQPRLELVGIGAVLEAKGDALVVTKVLPGGGAAEVGLVPSDAIVSIEGRLASNLGFAGGVELIRGEEGTTVLLSVRRADGALVDLRAPRRVIVGP